MVPEGLGIRPDAAPTTDVLHLGPYQTTRGAAIDAQDSTTRAHMGKVLGGSALLLGGYKALTAFPWMRKMKVPLAIGAGALGVAGLKGRPGEMMKTDEGYEIPASTELTMKSASQAALIHLVECAASPAYARLFQHVKIASATTTEEIAVVLGTIVLA